MYDKLRLYLKTARSRRTVRENLSGQEFAKPRYLMRTSMDRPNLSGIEALYPQEFTAERFIDQRPRLIQSVYGDE